MPIQRGGPLAPPLVPASTFLTPGDPHAYPFAYGRMDNPTWVALEAAHAELAGGRTVSFASGMAACAAVIDALLPRGGLVVAPADGYFTLRSLLAARCVPTRLVDSGDPLALAHAAPGAALVWLETPTNPGLNVLDIRATAAACRNAGALLVVDNTLASCAGQDVLGLGADVAVVSATKITSGHSDAVLGLAVAKSDDIVEKLRAARTIGGAIPGVLEAWLCLRGMKTLALRLPQASSSALAAAQMLSRFDARYPGLPGHPQHSLARAQMKQFGPVLTFDLGTRDRADRFLARLRLVAEATSFGGVETTVERRARWGGDAISPGLLRMSVGLEPIDLIIADLKSGLEGI